MTGNILFNFSGTRLYLESNVFYFQFLQLMLAQQLYKYLSVKQIFVFTQWPKLFKL